MADSTTFLNWLQSKSCHKVFVGTRIAEIQDLTDSGVDISPLPNKPANDITRGKTLAELTRLTTQCTGLNVLTKTDADTFLMALRSFISQRE